MKSNTRMIVLDDDPTGIQTVHGCLLVTDWSDSVIRQAFDHEEPFFYILTNTRAMTRDEAARTTRSAMEAVIRANRLLGYRLIFVSRSDSCLRGHFPLETDVMEQVLHEAGYKVWPKVPFCPAFIESGRYTIDGVHYMKDPATQQLIPVSETEFAHDNVFGYHTSVLRDYITEKGADASHYQIVNAQGYDELYAFCEQLEEETATFNGAIVIRSSSSLPKALSGIADQPLLTREALMGKKEGAGCYIVGSHVQKTTRQLMALLKEEGVQGIELPVSEILGQPAQLMSRVLKEMHQLAATGITPVVYTSRQEVRVDDPDKRQQLGKRVSDFLVSIVQKLPYTPSYLVAKGGITSHDILTVGLGVKVATVMGQAINSVPCIMTDDFAYIIFPGNVGGDDSLAEIYRKFR